MGRTRSNLAITCGRARYGPLPLLLLLLLFLLLLLSLSSDSLPLGLAFVILSTLSCEPLGTLSPMMLRG